MDYALDCEFMEDGHTIELLSIALVAENGLEFYAEVSDVDTSKANPWVQEHVLPHLWARNPHKREANAFIRDGGLGGLKTAKEIAQDIRLICDNSPTFWGYYSAYDWVALCQLFGTMIDLPKGWPMYCHDLRSWLDLHFYSHITQPNDMPHHALSDARWIMQTWQTYERLESAQP